RGNVFKIHTKKKPLAEDVNLAKLVEMTEGFSGAEIEGVCSRAAITAIKRYVNNKEKSVKSIKITQEDLLHAIKKLRPERASMHAVT
ncbi:MAG: AAA family ATPase, partial [Thaumarchaeota archaeon]|nr:AAA family ATPase [Nitrososphaerota archaeon]